MNSIPGNQPDDQLYQEASYYEAIANSLTDPDCGYLSSDLVQRSPLREQDRFLPIANVAKIMKKAIPSNGKVAKDAKECVQECLSEFISFITSEAAEHCQNEKRKTINGEDILWAMSSLGFENYVDPLKTFLLKLRDASKIDSSIFHDSSITPPRTNSMLVTRTSLARPPQFSMPPQVCLNGMEVQDVKPMMESDLKPCPPTTVTVNSSALVSTPQTALLLQYPGQIPFGTSLSDTIAFSN